MINKQNNQKACPTVFRKSELRRGFTLLETLVAISIITLTIVGPLAMAAQASKLISVAKNQLVANYLAQEAMELVRYEKDTNMILENANEDPDVTIDWLTGATTVGSLSGCMHDTDERACFVDSNPTPVFYPCYRDLVTCVGSNPNLVLTEANGYRPVISGATGTTTSFLRFIQIERFKMGADDPDVLGSGAKVKVKVTWKDTYGEKYLYVQENMYKYR